jgi:glucose-1-phosphate thymidylyltransferase
MDESWPAVTRAVIMARGLGTRMRRDDAAAQLDDAQAQAAAQGLKAMIPIGRPFLDYVLSALADAGYRDACLVIGPEHDAVRDYYMKVAPPSRVRVSFAIQQEPRGTADAVAAAESFAQGDRVLVLNADNYYPVDGLAALRTLPGSGLLGFERDALVRESNIEAERVRAYALLVLHDDGSLAAIIEKPDDATFARMHDAPVSMNVWVFTPAIFEACRRVRPSPRGELELADAVRIAMTELHERFDVIPIRAGVLDLSRRADIAAVKERLAGVEARP